MKKGLALILVAAMCLLLCACEKAENYEAAAALMEEARYEEAAAAFADLGSYKDSAERLRECENRLAYDRAVLLAEEGNYEEAAKIFKELGDYEDSAGRFTQCEQALSYENAVSLMEAGDYGKAAEIFGTLGDYRDSASKAEECAMASCYTKAMGLYEAERYEEAASAFEELGTYADSARMARECRDALSYAQAQSLFENGQYAEAEALFRELEDYADSAQKARECEDAQTYSDAVKLMEQGDYTEAMEAFSGISSYKDAEEKYRQCATMEALTNPLFAELEQIMKTGDVEEAVDHAYTSCQVWESNGYRQEDLRIFPRNCQPLDAEYVFEMGDGTSLTLPMTYGELYEAGWRVEYEHWWWSESFQFRDAELDDLIPGDLEYYLGFINKDGKGLHTRVCHKSGEPIPLRDLPVEWLAPGSDYTLECGEADLRGSYTVSDFYFGDGESRRYYDRTGESFRVNGIRQGATVEEVLDAFGWPYFIQYSKSTEDGESNSGLTFEYYGNPRERSEGYMTFEIDTKTGRLQSVGYSMEYISHHI